MASAAPHGVGRSHVAAQQAGHTLHQLVAGGLHHQGVAERHDRARQRRIAGASAFGDGRVPKPPLGACLGTGRRWRQHEQRKRYHSVRGDNGA